MNVAMLATFAFVALLIVFLILIHMFVAYVKETMDFIEKEKKKLRAEMREFQKVKEDE